MRLLTCYSLVFLFALVSQTPANASIVTETFSGSGALVTPGNTGDHTGNSFTVITSDAGSCVDIAFDVTVTVGGGPVHFDTRGFGDSGSSNDALQTTPAPAESLIFTLSTPTATLNAAGVAAGASIVSSTVVASFTSFDLVNNGGSPPAVTWTDSFGGTGTATAPVGSNSPDITPVAVTSGTTSIDIDPTAAWMWINNAQFVYSGDVEVDKPETVPEPGSLAILLAGLGLFSARRRR